MEGNVPKRWRQRLRNEHASENPLHSDLSGESGGLDCHDGISL